MSVFAFVFARAGSKGVVNKNLREIGGISLVEHAVVMAKDIEEVSKVFVSSDCPEILALASSCSVETIVRPAELASDTASEWSAWKHAVEHVKHREQVADFTFLSLSPTSPLRLKKDVIAVLQDLSTDVDAVLAICRSNHNPNFNMVRVCEGNRCKLLNNNSAFHRRQDAPEVFEISTVAYATTSRYIEENEHLFQGRVNGVVVDKKSAVDIDDEIDLLVATELYNRRTHYEK